MNKKIKLIALDLDGTLLTNEKKVTADTVKILKEAKEKGIYVVVSTGRPYGGLPIETLEKAGMEYAIISNGASIYKIAEKECLYSNGISTEYAAEIIAEMQNLGVHIDAVIDGQAYGDKKAYDNIERLDLSASMKDYMRTSRVYVDDLLSHIHEKQQLVQKITLNFYRDDTDAEQKYQQIVKRFSAGNRLNVVSGGGRNLEITKKGISKGTALLILAEILKIDIAQTMACGDSENDLDILKTAAVGVAMENAQACVKEIADYITLSNEADGVAHAIQKLVFPDYNEA